MNPADHRSDCPFHSKAEQAPLSAPFDEEAAAVSTKKNSAESPKTGILLVSHGSHSATWRRMLLDVHAEVQEDLLRIPSVQTVRTAFMEYTEPSIASQLRRFDAEGVEQILVIPLLLTISNHSFDDIPAICGQKEDASLVASLEEEGIERYRPRAEVKIAPLLDYPNLVRLNLARRVNEVQAHCSITSEPVCKGCVLVGYGSEEFDAEWNSFFVELSDYLVIECGLKRVSYAWCGHLVKYSPEPTAKAIQEALEESQKAMVIPVLVAHDEMFQDKIIGKGIHQSGRAADVLYRADAILPEPAVGQWVISIARESLIEA